MNPLPRATSITTTKNDRRKYNIVFLTVLIHDHVRGSSRVLLYFLPDGYIEMDHDEAIVLTKMKNKKGKRPLTPPSKQLGRCKYFPRHILCRAGMPPPYPSSMEVALCRTLVKIRAHTHTHTTLVLGLFIVFYAPFEQWATRNVFAFDHNKQLSDPFVLVGLAFRMDPSVSKQ